jgi:hypothetical protein
MANEYQAVVFRTNRSSAINLFERLDTAVWLRLVSLARGVYAIYRPLVSNELLNKRELNSLGRQLSLETKHSVLAVFNECLVDAKRPEHRAKGSVLFRDGRQIQDFGENDEWWVPLNARGEAIPDGPRLRHAQLFRGKNRNKWGYGLVWSAIDAGLESANLSTKVSELSLVVAFYYLEVPWIAERLGD